MRSHSRYGQNNSNHTCLKESREARIERKEGRQHGMRKDTELNWHHLKASSFCLVKDWGGNYPVLDNVLTEIMVHLQVWFSHCEGFTFCLPEWRTLYIPGQLLQAIEKNWTALFPSLWCHFLLYKGSKSAKNYIRVEEEQEGNETTENSRKESTRFLGLNKFYWILTHGREHNIGII